MIITEHYKTRADGVKLIRTYSDADFRIVRNDGIVYDEAIDIENSGYTYEESDELIEKAIEDTTPDDTGDDFDGEDETPVEEEVSAEDALAELLEVLES